MKKVIIFSLASVLFCIFACTNNPQPTTIAPEKVDSLNTKEEGHLIDYDNTKVLEVTYVTDRSGVEMKQQPDDNSLVLGMYDYGDKLEIIEMDGDWLGVRERITREIQGHQDGKKVVRSAWEKVYVQKSKTGNLGQVYLTLEDLKTLSSGINIMTNGDLKNYDDSSKLAYYIQMELVDKSLFSSKKSTAADLYTYDTLAIRKINGIIELYCEKKNVRFEDNTETDGDDFKEYEYIGQIESLNKYVISGRYYENWDYEFVDKTSGEITSFVDYPYVSPDGKYLICIAANPYESTADMELWQIVNKNPKLLMSASFTNWMPAGENSEIFWSRDGYLYLPVLHSKTFWTGNGDLSKKYQYIRIKVRIQ